MKHLILAQINSELKRRGITQKDISIRLGKSPTTVSSWLTRGNITIKKLDEILIVYEIKIDKIYFK